MKSWPSSAIRLNIRLSPEALMNCNAGYYGPGGDSCATCDAGSWCPGGTTITACPAISTSAAGSDAITDCVCIAGYYVHAASLTCSGSCPCSPSSGQRSGTIRSNDGSRYGNYESCTWVISGTGPSITFSAFSTESCCDYVYVEECYDSACSGGPGRSEDRARRRGPARRGWRRFCRGPPRRRCVKQRVRESRVP